MKTIRTTADFAALSEDDKDAVFSFATARGRLKHKLISVFMISGLVIAGSMLFMAFSWSVDGMESFSWVGYVGGVFGFLSIPVFGRELKAHYQVMQYTRRLLTDRGIDASRIKSEAIWESFETNSNRKKGNE